MTKRRQLGLLLVMACIAVSFLPVLQNNFIKGDENRYLINNPLVRDLSWRGLKNIFGSYFYCMYQPLVILSFVIEHHLFGEAPVVYHATNLIFHLLNSLLVFSFIFRLGRSYRTALLVALFFGIHPMHVESVAFIAERKDMLYTFFFLASLILYLRYLDSRKWLTYTLSVASFGLSLLAKPAGVLLPLVLFLCDFFRRRRDQTALLDKTPFLCLALFFGALGLIGQSTEMIGPLKPSLHFAYSLYAVFFYISKTILPIDLSLLYPVTDTARIPLTELWVFPVAGAIVFGLIRLKKYREALFGGLFYLITIVPGLEIMPINVSYSQAFVADHYSYVPSIGIFYLAACSLEAFYLSGATGRRRVLLALLVLTTLAFCYATHRRCLVWRNGLTLYTDVLKQFPHYAHARDCYNAYAAFDRNISFYSKEIARSPGNAKLYYNRAVFYSNVGLGSYKNALADYDRAIALDPNVAEFFLNRGTIYQEQGMTKKALEDYEEALELKPELWQARFNRSLLKGGKEPKTFGRRN